MSKEIQEYLKKHESTKTKEDFFSYDLIFLLFETADFSCSLYSKVEKNSPPKYQFSFRSSDYENFEDFIQSNRYKIRPDRPNFIRVRFPWEKKYRYLSFIIAEESPLLQNSWHTESIL